MNKTFICNLITATLLCCVSTSTAQILQDECASTMSVPWKTQLRAAPVGYVYGDVNGDDKTDISDVVSIINAIAQNDKSNPRADVNEDGNIDISDVVKVINIMAGIDTPPITVDKSSLDMTTGESEDVRIVRVSGIGDYEVTNENPDIIMVEWFSADFVMGKSLSDTSTASERRKVAAIGDTKIGEDDSFPTDGFLKVYAQQPGQAKFTVGDKNTSKTSFNKEIGEGDSFSTDGFLKIYALQPGQANITIVDKNTSSRLNISINVTADYNTEIFSSISPDNTYVPASKFACKFIVMPPWTGKLKCRIILGEVPNLSGTVKTTFITIDVTKGKPIYYNFNSQITTFSNLKSDTKYYWRITYYDPQSESYLNGSPIYKFKTITLCPDKNHPHIIDMGNAGKWACCNVGANAPWEYGGRYAWGETEEKDEYSWETYIHCDGNQETCHDIGEDIAGTEFDVAHVKWGGNWCMPNHEQQELLSNNCTSVWMSVNGINGRKFTSSNGGTIFLPVAGQRDGRYWCYIGSYGFYWSSTQSPNYYGRACYLFFDQRDYSIGQGNLYRNLGFSVRPITE